MSITRPSKKFIRVRVSAGAKKEKVEKTEKGIKISVKEKAQRGEANTRVKELLARTLQVSLARLRLIKGHTSPSKIFEIIG